MLPVTSWKFLQLDPQRFFSHAVSNVFNLFFYLLQVYQVNLILLVFPSYCCIYTLFKALCYKWLMHVLLYYI